MIRFSAACMVVSIAVPLMAAGLDDLAVVQERTSHRASSHDVTGGNEDSLVSFAPGETRVLLDTDGPGQIAHMWFTVARFAGDEPVLRHIVLRMFWEKATVPSVEVPLGDFFGLGHGRLYTYQSLPMTVGGNPCAMNCYWPMPFYKHVRIEIANVGDRSVRRVYYNLDYELGSIPRGQGLFHALYKRDRALPGQSYAGNTTGKDNYVILETEGRGHYVGCTLGVDAKPGGWWGEGDDMIFIDRSDKPVIIGTGSEDYFCNAWGYDQPFSYPFYGATLLEKHSDKSSLSLVYRWHVADPVRFHKHIKVTIEHCWNVKLLNDFTTVAYWYQTEPVKSRPPLPTMGEGLAVATSRPAPGPSLEGNELEVDCLARGLKARAITVGYHDGYKSGGWLQIDTGGQPIELRIPVPKDGQYAVSIKPVVHVLDGPIQMAIEGGEPKKVDKPATVVDTRVLEARVPFVDLGTATSANGVIVVTVSGSKVVGIDAVKVLPAASGK